MSTCATCDGKGQIYDSEDDDGSYIVCPTCRGVKPKTDAETIDDLRAQLVAAQGEHKDCADLLTRAAATVEPLKDALAAARIREGQLGEALRCHVTHHIPGTDTVPTDWAGRPLSCECSACLLALSSPPDVPDVLGAVRTIARCLYDDINDCEHTTKDIDAALATLRAAGVLPRE